jgi:hypothetical protein
MNDCSKRDEQNIRKARDERRAIEEAIRNLEVQEEKQTI